MRFQKFMRNLAIILLIICVIVIAIDMFKILKINFEFVGMQSSERISSSSRSDAVRYEPTSYTIVNKEDAFEEIKNIVVALQNKHVNSNDTTNLFEIANIHKIENYFYEYQKYIVVKYKLLNIIEDLPKLYAVTKGYSNEQLGNYYSQNIVHIEKYYGITNSEDFIKLAKSLNFLENGKIDIAILQDVTVNFDYDNDLLTFYMRMIAENGNDATFFVKTEYYRTSNNQVTPYVSFKVVN